MQMIEMRNTDLKVSRLIAGCMGLGGGWDVGGGITKDLEDEADRFLDAALELGINFFDHADIYARGRAEEVFGRVLSRRPDLRNKIVIQSKCGIRWANDPPGAPQRFDFSTNYILKAVDSSLRRLGIDYLDILLLHRPDVLWEGEEIARAFDKLKSSGKVRYFGVSNQNRAWMEYLQRFLPDPLVANQLQMSLIHHDFAEVGISFNQTIPNYPNGWEGVVEYCRLEGVSLQAWSPLDKGMLMGKDAIRSPGVVGDAAALINQYADEKCVPPEAIALAWLLRHPAGIQPVLGTTKPNRLTACAKAVETSLSREEWYSLFAAVRGRPMP